MGGGHSGTEHKRRMVELWNEMAPRYHSKWAGPRAGPFQCTAELPDRLGIVEGSQVLDIGCGTGAAINLLAGRVGSCGLAVGLDSSFSAVKIACRGSCADFVVADAEVPCIRAIFDIIVCQFALFLFPDARRVLASIKDLMGSDGILAVAVHGAGGKTPYFRTILDQVLRFVPDYVPPGAPDFDRYGTEESLSKVVSEAGFAEINVRELEYEYSPGTAERYWKEYLQYVPVQLRAKLDVLPAERRAELEEAVLAGARRFERDDRVVFPWQVLMLTARKS